MVLAARGFSENTNSGSSPLMSLFEGSRSVWTDRMLSVLRIVAGLLFFEHGMQKMFNLPPGQMKPVGFTLASQMGLAAILEVFGGACVLLGLLTRPWAFLLAGEMAVAYFQVHNKRSVFPIKNGGESVILFCFVFLYLIFAGAGPWSLDRLIARSKRAA